MIQNIGCRGNTIRVRSGTWLDLADPREDQFTLSDIAGGLSKICRFGGQTNRFYSVAEHSVLCAEVASLDGLPLATQRALLLHDATEAFYGDMVKPLKIMMPDYVVAEKRMERVIAKKFGLSFDDTRIHEIDIAMCFAERRQLFTRDGVTLNGESSVRRLDVTIECLGPLYAENLFLNAALLLGIK